MKNILRAIVLSGVLLFAAAHNSFAYTQEELALQRVLDRMNALERSMATMQQELYRSGGKSKKKGEISQEPIGAEDERMRAFNGRIEELQHNIDTLAAKLDKIIADIDFRLSALEKRSAEAMASAPAVANTATPATADSNQPVDIIPEEVVKALAENSDEQKKEEAPAEKPEDAAKADYDKAYQFISLSKYDDAEKAFKDFIAKHKGHKLIENAYFWLGESYYSKQNYQQAAVNFLKVYQEFPKGNKAAEGLYKLGMSLKSMKKEKEACATFSKAKKEYPSSDKVLIGKIDSEYKELKCK